MRYITSTRGNKYMAGENYYYCMIEKYHCCYDAGVQCKLKELQDDVIYILPKVLGTT